MRIEPCHAGGTTAVRHRIKSSERRMAWQSKNARRQSIQHTRQIAVHLARPHLSHAVLALDKVTMPLGSVTRSLIALICRHEIDDTLERERHEIDDMRADRHLPFKAPAGKTPV